MVQVEQKKSSNPAGPSVDSDRWLEIFSLFIHDLESPITTIKYLLGLIDSGRLDMQNDRHQTIVSSSKIALERAETILYDIMDVAKAGKAGLPVRMKDIVPTAVIEEAIGMIQGNAQENGVEISFTNNSGNTPVQADPKLLKRVLDNLLFNALRHTPNGGKLAIYTELAQRSLFVHVKDTGPGLGDIDPTLLFEKFGQVQLRADGKHRGVGLGLYFCKLAANGMGGTILADDHPHGGSVFSIKLKKARE